ncbi:MAG: cytochrome c biogenesis protein CcsA [Bacteriovorax sp.]|nr:cytochrome c biogenesis protein CcsA [Bacteriovorax sp.]
MKKILLLSLISMMSIFSSTLMAETYFCKKDLEKLPILQGGRVKPLFVHASEAIKNLTGSTNVKEYGPVEAYCLLSLNGMGLVSDLKLEARIDHVDLMNFLNLPADKHTITYDELLSREESIKNEARMVKDNASYKKAIGKLYDNMFLYKEIKSGENWLLANTVDNHIEWQPLIVYLTEDKVVAQKALTPEDPFLPVLLRTKTEFDKTLGNTKYELELYYAKAGLASWALMLTILAFATLVLFKNFNIALGLASISVVVQLVLIALRVIISGRAPITNMYETVLFSGFGSLTMALILGHFKKEKLFVFMGLGYNVCTLMMLNFANGMLTATISPLVPVLRDNFWLSTHVTMVILSYGALALSWILANSVLFRRKWGSIHKKEELVIADVIYTTLKWGTTMLAAGVILGGVWADYSWGRFWGWDPKETWSLIVLCTYMAILHGRHTSWIKTDRFITVTAGAFMSVMMAWFGVNYILATGLHSYGFSEGGAIFLGSFFLVQIVVLVVTGKSKNPDVDVNVNVKV